MPLLLSVKVAVWLVPRSPLKLMLLGTLMLDVGFTVMVNGTLKTVLPSTITSTLPGYVPGAMPQGIARIKGAEDCAKAASASDWETVLVNDAPTLSVAVSAALRWFCTVNVPLMV